MLPYLCDTTYQPGGLSQTLQPCQLCRHALHEMPYWICIFGFSLGAAILMLYQGCSTWSLFLMGELAQFVWGQFLAGVLALEKVQCFMGFIA